LLGIAQAQAARDRISDAIDTVISIKGIDCRISALKAILRARLRSGGISGAEEVAAAVVDESLGEEAWEVLRNEEILSGRARTLAEAGDIVAARQIAERLTGKTFLRAAWLPILAKMMELGDGRGVVETMASLPISSTEVVSWVHDLVLRLTSTGHIFGALEICLRYSDGPGLYLLALIVVPLQARSGDVAGARKTIERELLHSEGWRDITYGLFGREQARHVEGLRDIAYCLLAEEQARNGDRNGACDSAVKIADASLRQSTMERIAETTRGQGSEPRTP